ncbi:MAG TPA: aldehyde dehydrogenase family protein [Umezawaea sp.]|nr:aldehyde dehydrogenase family protein [Umezawaea sp.]
MSTTEQLVSNGSGVPAPSDRLLLDEAVRDAAAGAARWAELPLGKRADLLHETRRSIGRQAARWVRTAADVKRLAPSSPLLGEEWTSGPYATLMGVGALAHSVEALASGRSPVPDRALGTGPGGRVTVEALPGSAYEWLLLNGFRATIWMPPGTSRDQVVRSAGLGQLSPGVDGGVGLVLGAGNITSIAPLDVLYELVAHNRAVVLKLNPVMAPMMSVYLAALAPLVRDGYLRVVQGGAEAGRYLSEHQGIGHVHITGSRLTHDAIVWGTGDQAEQRRRAGTPLLTKPITSELGGVSPTIVVPGRWSRRDLRYQAEHVATQRLHNAGHNCVAAQVVLVGRDWPQKDAFLAELRAALHRVPARETWYPGSARRVDTALTDHPDATRLGPDRRRLLVEVPADGDSPLTSTEYFAPVLGVTELGGDPRTFLRAAVEFANTSLSGTLGANIIVAPHDRKALGTAFDEAVADLRYGTIGVNAWTGLAFLSATATWGAYPGHTPEDVQSGIGVVHNAMLLDAPERTVVHGPFRPFPRSVLHGEPSLSPMPPWFATARSAARTGELLTRFAAAPAWRRVPGIVLSAFRA